MSESFSWWLAVEVIGLLTLPLCLAAFASLSDRGYALSKPFGLLLIGYLFWLLNSLHVFPNSRRGIVWIVVLVGLASAGLAWSRRDDLRSFLVEHWRHVLLVEALFLLAFVIAAWLRSFVPQVAGTEKPMDFMYVNAATRADHFPPADPWLAGYRVSYYYFGYLLTAMVGKLAGVDTNVGYNLGLAMTVALGTVAAFGVGYNLVASYRSAADAGAGSGTPDPPTPRPPSRGRSAAAVLAEAPAAPLVDATAVLPYIFGLAAALFVVVLGNLEGALEFLAAHDLLPHGWYGFIDIKNLAPYSTDHFYPDEKNQYWWWFRASRIIPHGEITEFPNFSFVLGDLHPHVTAIPFGLLAVGLALALFRSGDALDRGFWTQRPSLLLWSAVSLGGLAFLNTWDMPTLTVVVLAAALIRNHQPGGPWLPALQRTLFFAMPLVALMLVLYIPFYRGFTSQASGFGVVSGHTTRLLHLLIFWGPFAVLLVPFVAVRLWESVRRRPLAAIDAVVAAPLPLAIILLWLAWAFVAGAPGNPVRDRSTGWITDLALVAFLGASVLALWRGVEAESEPSERRGPAVFALLLTVVAVLLVLGPEFYFVKDLFKSRMNTVFKLYYQAWLLAALASAFALYYLLRCWEAVTPAAATVRAAWGGLAALVLLAGLLYPVGATLARTDGFSGERSLDALIDVKKSSPDEYAAIEWLKDREDAPVIVEAPGKSYTYPGRVSAATGLPTVIEWPGHESQWRGQESSKDWFGRFDEVQQLYTTTERQQALNILRRYGVTFVYVGKSERELFPPAALAKFDDMMDVAFKQGTVTIYRVRPR